MLEGLGWQGPIKSSYGHHIVFIDTRSEAKPIPLETVRNQIVRDLVKRQKDAATSAAIKALRNKYEISTPPISSDRASEETAEISTEEAANNE